MRAIQVETVQVQRKSYRGKEAFLVVDPATGLVLAHVKSDKDGTREALVPAGRDLFVGTDAEIEAKKVECDAKFAPIKAQREKDAADALATRKAPREAALKQ